MKFPKEVATLEYPAISPSGQYKLTLVEASGKLKNQVYFKIEPQNDGMPYICTDQFDIRHTTFFLWDDHDRVWVYSGDLGTFFWEFSAKSNQWEKKTYQEENVTAPPFLKESRPKWHKK